MKNIAKKKRSICANYLHSNLFIPIFVIRKTTKNQLIMEATAKIQELKWMLVNYIAKDRWNNNSQMGMKDEMLSLVGRVAMANLGFASEIATTVEKFERCSEKQAYWIAKVAVEKELTSKIDYLFNS